MDMIYTDIYLPLLLFFVDLFNNFYTDRNLLISITSVMKVTHIL